MPIPGLDPKKCEQRNRIDARRYRVEATPIRFLGREAASLSAFASAPAVEDLAIDDVAEDDAPDEVPANPGDAGHSGCEAPAGATTHGELPLEEAEALAAINARLPQGSPRLEASDVYIHYVEAASNNFIGDRYAFLSEQTLKNIADGGSAGVAFMNSHKTGSMSHESELPFGKTFAGQFQQFTDAEGRVVQRTILGFYMVRGQFPNGANGPSTDDLDAGIRGGTIFDVSVGLGGGKAICDVCGNKVNDEECNHSPATHYGMSEEEIERQRARGVTEGRASYTIDGARLGEVSAVYDGAVPGAGFRKAIALSANFSPAELDEVKRAYSALIGPENEDFNMSETILGRFAAAIGEGVALALKGMGLGPKAEADASASEGKEGEDLAVTGDPLVDAHLNPPEDEEREKGERDAAAAPAEGEAVAEGASDAAAGEGEGSEGEGEGSAEAEAEADAAAQAGAENDNQNDNQTAGGEAAGAEASASAAAAATGEGAGEAAAADTGDAASASAAPAEGAAAEVEAEASASEGEGAASPADQSAAADAADTSADAGASADATAGEAGAEASASADAGAAAADVSADLASALPTSAEQLAAMLKEAAAAGARAAADAFKPQVEELTGKVTDLQGKLDNAVEVKKPSKLKAASDFLKLVKEQGRHIPADDKDLIRDHVQFAIDDELSPVSEGPSRVERFESTVKNRKQHGMFVEALDSEADRVLLANVETSNTNQPASRKAELLSATALGQSAQKAKK